MKPIYQAANFPLIKLKFISSAVIPRIYLTGHLGIISPTPQFDSVKFLKSKLLTVIAYLKVLYGVTPQSTVGFSNIPFLIVSCEAVFSRKNFLFYVHCLICRPLEFRTLASKCACSSTHCACVF